MSVLTNRSDLELALGRALSRHIGHTTAAYDLERILSVSRFFHDRPSGYKEEITQFLQAKASDAGDTKLTADYLDGTVSFARAFGIIQLVSGRDARLQRFAPTEQGRSLLAAQLIGDQGFARFYAARTAFLADADSLTALLTYYRDEPPQSLLDHYVAFFVDIRERRRTWLMQAFSERMLRGRIVEHIAWLKEAKRGASEPSIDPFTANTARHHATPRKGWLIFLGMLKGEQLTPFGERALASLVLRKSYFWLGPPRGVQEALKIPTPCILHGPYEDELDFSTDLPSATAEQEAALTGDVAEILAAAFPFARLIHANQASLQIAVEFVRYRSFTDELRYDFIAILEQVFQEYREKFDRFSALKGQIGFYRIK